jgi:hypothetical protein
MKANFYRIRTHAQHQQALALAAQLYWAHNWGWSAPDGGSIASGQILERKSSGRATGRFFYSDKSEDVYDDCRVCICFEMDVFSGEYKQAFENLEAWEQQAITAYYKRNAVSCTQKTKFERKNPERHTVEGASLFIAPPDLEHHAYSTQVSAFMALASTILTPPRIIVL